VDSLAQDTLLGDRYRLTRRIAIGGGCVSEGPGGWTRLRVERPGRVVLEASFALGRVRASAPRCTH